VILWWSLTFLSLLPRCRAVRTSPRLSPTLAWYFYHPRTSYESVIFRFPLRLAMRMPLPCLARRILPCMRRTPSSSPTGSASYPFLLGESSKLHSQSRQCDRSIWEPTSAIPAVKWAAGGSIIVPSVTLTSTPTAALRVGNELPHNPSCRWRISPFSVDRIDVIFLFKYTFLL